MVHIDIRTSKRYYHLIDTPGFDKYTRNKIKGIAQAEAALFVISATVFEKDKNLLETQVKENMVIAQAMGIRQIIVAVNKIDEIYEDSEYVNYLTE